MKKLLILVVILTGLSSCIGQNAPLENTTITAVEYVQDSLQYIRLSNYASAKSSSTYETYIATYNKDFRLNDTIIFISKRELRHLIHETTNNPTN